MSGDPAAPARKRRLWINLGEVAAVAAVAISALSYWDAHRDHAASAGAAEDARKARAVLLIVGAPEDGGRRLILRPLDSAQALQAQRIFLPSAMRAAPIDVAAATPSIESAWLSAALDKRLDGAHAPAAGGGWVPVALFTTYAEGGDIRVDRSLYRVGYAWQSRFLAGRRIELLGLALIRHGVARDPTASLDRLWVAAPHTAPAGG